jgi:hypothetical protein
MVHINVKKKCFIDDYSFVMNMNLCKVLLDSEFENPNFLFHREIPSLL